MVSAACIALILRFLTDPTLLVASHTPGIPPGALRSAVTRVQQYEVPNLRSVTDRGGMWRFRAAVLILVVILAVAGANDRSPSSLQAAVHMSCFAHLSPLPPSPPCLFLSQGSPAHRTAGPLRAKRALGREDPPEQQCSLPSQDDERSLRFGGVEKLHGDGSLARLHKAHVCIFGVGGVGSWTAEAIVRSSVGKLTIVDMDEVRGLCILSQTSRVRDETCLPWTKHRRRLAGSESRQRSRSGP